jgi:hypothetical protein
MDVGPDSAQDAWDDIDDPDGYEDLEQRERERRLRARARELFLEAGRSVPAWAMD